MRLRIQLVALCAIVLSHVAVTPQGDRAADPTGAKEPTVTVAAGKFDRELTVVHFTVPDGAAWADLELRDEAGTITPLQTDGTRAAFIVRSLKAGQERTYSVQPPTRKAAVPSPVMTATRDGGAVKIAFQEKEVLRYQGEKTPLPAGYDPAFQRGGYLFPVLTPLGKSVADDYPPDHKHHHGIWSPWTKTEFEGRHPDFWNMAAKTGTVEFVALGETWSGNVHAGFRARHRFVDLSAKPEPKPVLNEEWDVRVYRFGPGQAYAKPYYLFDWQSTQTCAEESPLILPKYHYGGLGFRGNRAWDGKDNCRFLTSEGKGRSNGNETRARWCTVSGDIDGAAATVAILCPPDNFRAPQPVRLHPTEPFFCYVPQQVDAFKIEPGKPYVAQYRFVVFDGEVKADEVERLWNDYATPPVVTVR